MRQCYETVEKQGRERERSDAQLYGQLAVLQSRAAPSFDSVPPIIVADHYEQGRPRVATLMEEPPPCHPFFLFNGQKPPRNLISRDFIARV